MQLCKWTFLYVLIYVCGLKYSLIELLCLNNTPCYSLDSDKYHIEMSTQVAAMDTGDTEYLGLHGQLFATLAIFLF